MPTSIASLLVVIIAVVPGILGNAVFTRLLGTDWREKESATVARVIAFSVFGLALYALAGRWFNVPEPAHILPATYAAPNLGAAAVTHLAGAYLGHTIGSGLAGALAALGTALLSKVTGRSAHPAAWDEYVAKHVRGRWVVVTLTSGESYCGKIETADASIDAAQRDILLCEPAAYDADRGNYFSTAYRHLFIRSALVDSVASLRDPQLDRNLSTHVGEPLFPGEDDEQEEQSQPEPAANVEVRLRPSEELS